MADGSGPVKGWQVEVQVARGPQWYMVSAEHLL